VTAQTPLREDSSDMHCRRHAVMNDLGTFEYTTTLTEGSIKFVLVAQDNNAMPVARGETMPLDIKPGQTVTSSVTAVAVPGYGSDAGTTATPDAGAGD
jgi:hypothetical protein